MGLLLEALWRESLRSSMLRRVFRYWGLSTADERAVNASSNRTAPPLPLVCAVRHRHRNCAHPDHICPGTGAPLPHLNRDCAHPCHTHLRGDLMYLPRTRLTHLHRDWRPLPTALPHLRRDSAAVRSGRDRRQLVHGARSSDLLAMRQLPRRVSVRKRCVTYAHKPRQALSHACTARTPVGAS
jgi:hypothetical protein